MVSSEDMVSAYAEDVSGKERDHLDFINMVNMIYMR